MATVLELVKAVCYENGITNVPSTLVSVTSASDLRMLHSFYAIGRDLRQANCWPQLKRQHTIYLQAGRTQYPLPGDFYAGLPDTYWDQQNHLPLTGPMSDSGFALRRYGYTSDNQKGFRVFGPDGNQADTRGQIMIDPVPGASTAGQSITIEYLSKSWLSPPNWAASTAYLINDYVNANGNIYKAFLSATTTTKVPTVGANGTGQDGGVFWTSLTVNAWANLTAYAPQDYVTNGSNLYVCTVGGVSAASVGPTGTAATPVTDGTVSWVYCATPVWTAETTIANGAFLKVGSNYYKSTTPVNTLASVQVTGKSQPNWFISSGNFVESDGTQSWIYQPASYETIVKDTDFCLFDDDLMILGVAWRYLRSSGMQYEALQSEYEIKKKRAVSRWNVGQKINLAGGSAGGPNFVLPEGNFGL